MSFLEFKQTATDALHDLPPNQLRPLKFAFNAIRQDMKTKYNKWSKEDKTSAVEFIIQMVLWASLAYRPDNQEIESSFVSKLAINLLDIDQSPTEFMKIMTGSTPETRPLFSDQMLPMIKGAVQELLERYPIEIK